MIRTEKEKVRARVNTWLLVLLTIVIPIMTLLGAQKLYMYSKNFIGISDAPGICYDEIKDKNIHIRENAYPCVTDGEPVTSDNENVIFLYNQMNFLATVHFREMLIVLLAIGAIATAASFIGTIVYWNHNR